MADLAQLFREAVKAIREEMKAKVSNTITVAEAKALTFSTRQANDTEAVELLEYLRLHVK